MGHRVIIDKDLCVSAGACVNEDPAAFDYDEDGVAEVLPGAEGLNREKLIEIARLCPAHAIRIQNGQGEDVEWS